MIFRDESAYLREWIDFHRGVGVEHFYLYNNRSTDDFQKEIVPYVERRIVTLTDWPQVPGQRTAYEHCVRNNAMTARWIAFVDADEFLYSPLEADVRTILKKYEHLPAIKVARYEFGSSGHKIRPDGSILSSYTFRHTHPRGGKSINNPRLIRRIKSAHGCQFYGSSLPSDCDTDMLRINHYWSRSFEELAKKQQKVGKGIARTQPFPMAEMLAREATDNEVEDRVIIDIARASRATSN